jgi:hypothetical protein
MANAIGITNAKWWLNHSIVTLKSLYLAGDEAYVVNNITSVEGTGTDNVNVVMKSGNQGLLKIQRMVLPNSVVAVMLRDGTTYEVNLPNDAENLFSDDLKYISAQIDAISKPMTAQEQIDFLKSANAPLETTSSQES